jgi:hypothetical protein
MITKHLNPNIFSACDVSKLTCNLSPGVSGAKFPGIRSHMQRAIGEVYSGTTEIERQTRS